MQLVLYEMQKNAQGIYVADVLWTLASGNRLSSNARPFSEIISRKRQEDKRTADEILADIAAKLGGKQCETI